MPEEIDFQRFLDAQNETYSSVVAELTKGQKLTHWMWFIFPQIAGLGFSHLAQYYAIHSLGQALAYLRHPVLGPRLIECTQLVKTHADVSSTEIFGPVDSLKFHSSMTLFNAATPEDPHFRDALDVFYAGRQDQATLDILQQKHA